MQNKLFFELLRVAIGKSVRLSRTPTETEWGELYSIAFRHALIGVTFAGIRRLVDKAQRPPSDLYSTWMSMAAVILLQNEKLNKQCVELQGILAEKGFRSCIFKGQANTVLYNTYCLDENVSLGSLRQSGDIDIWIEGGRKRVIELVQSVSPTKEIRETHAQLKLFKGTAIEAHYRPGLIRDFIRNRKLQRFFTEEAEECFSNSINLSNSGPQNLSIFAPTQRFNAVHQMLHIYHHLFDGGIGLRQVMDYYFVLCHLPKKEYVGVVNVLRSLGAIRFAAALMYVLEEVFSLDKDLMLCEADEKDGAFLLNEIMRSGNFGHYDKRNAAFNMESHCHNFFGIIGRNLTYLRFAPWDWLMSPLWRISHFSWRKWNDYD